MDEVFRALVDPTRRRLFDSLHTDNDQSLNALSTDFKMSRQALAKDLELLEAANRVVTVQQERENLHYLNPVPPQEIYTRWIRKLELTRLQILSDLKVRLEKEERDG